MSANNSPLWVVDTIKAIASQLIVWHHFVAYGPMAKVLYPHLPGIMDWLYFDGRQVVQSFLVVGGFLAARSFAATPDACRVDTRIAALPLLALRRYVRLAEPYVLALLLAIACAMVTRMLIEHPDTPAAPTWRQLLAHLFLMQDMVGVDALSTGVWYVAIDFQLFCLFILLSWSGQRLKAIDARLGPIFMFASVSGLYVASLFWIGREAAFDIWAPYYFGAYGLGIMVQWSSGLKRHKLWAAVMVGIMILALAIEWRSRMVVALGSALLLTVGLSVRNRMPDLMFRGMAWLGKISYPVFLIHYPIILLFGGIVERFWPGSAAMSLTGMLAAWGTTLFAGAALEKLVSERLPLWKQRLPAWKPSPVQACSPRPV